MRKSFRTEQRCDSEDRNWQRQRTNAGSFLQKRPVLTSFAVTGGQITNWYELQQGCHVCSGSQQEHNASALPSVKAKEWHRPYWPWIRHHSSLSHTSSLIPLSLLITAQHSHTHTHTHTVMQALKSQGYVHKHTCTYATPNLHKHLVLYIHTGTHYTNTYALKKLLHLNKHIHST